MKIKELESKNSSLIASYMEIREMMNSLEKKIALKIDNSKINNSNIQNNFNSTFKKLNNFVNSSNYTKMNLNSSTEDIYNASMNSSVNHGSLKLMSDLKNVKFSFILSINLCLIRIFVPI